MEFIKNLWSKMNDAIENIHSEKKISPNDFLWRIQKWAWFGKLWNPKPMNYCPYYWMGVFTTLMTFLIPIIPIVHLFYYMGLGIKILSIKVWKNLMKGLNYIADIIIYLLKPIRRLLSYLNNKVEKWLDSIVVPIKEKKVEKRKIELSEMKINDKILYYLLEYDYFDFIDIDTDADTEVKRPKEMVKDYLVSLIKKSNIKYDYSHRYSENYVNSFTYKKLRKLEGFDKNKRKIRKKDLEDVQSWLNNNPNWFKQYKSFIKSKFKTYKRSYEWEQVKNEFEYSGSKGLEFEKFKEFKTELTDLEKLKKRNKIINKAIAFTKVFAKVLVALIALALVALGIWGLTFVTNKAWVITGIVSAWVVGVIGVVFLIVIGIQYLIRDTKFSEKFGKIFGSIWKGIKIIFLPLTFIFKMIGRKVSMLLDWKKENCPHIVYEGFEDEC